MIKEKDEQCLRLQKRSLEVEIKALKQHIEKTNDNPNMRKSSDVSLGKNENKIEVIVMNKNEVTLEESKQKSTT